MLIGPKGLPVTVTGSYKTGKFSGHILCGLWPPQKDLTQSASFLGPSHQVCMPVEHLLDAQASAECPGMEVLIPGLKVMNISFSTTEGVSEQDGGSILQRAAVAREDSGTYVCWAENRVGRVQAVSFIHVKGRTEAHMLFPHRPP